MGVRTIRAERMMIANLDPRIGKLAEIGDRDPQYKMLIHHVENQTERKHLEDNSELKQVGVVVKELGIFTCESGLKLVVRNGQELYIPQMARKEMILELHSTHMSTEGMKKLARKKFWWPQIGRDLETIYEACNVCKVNSRRTTCRGSVWR